MHTPLITVLTPTYNRASLLPRLYDSLCRQTFIDFEWIVIDDGSIDNTQDLFRTSLTRNLYLKEEKSDGCNDNHFAEGDHRTIALNFKDNSFHVRYFKKQNEGKHTAVNLGVRQAQGELVFIADSDDMLPPDSLQIVAKEWEKVKDTQTIGGIAGLDINAKDGTVIGSGLPYDFIDCNAIDIRYKYHVKGDLKEVFRTFVLKEYPFPEIVGERFCPEQLDWFRIAQKYNLHYINKPIYIAEYLAVGISAGITKVRMQSPIASMMTYAEMLAYEIPLKKKVKAAINYWRFRCCYKRTEQNKHIKMPKVPLFYTLMAPVGWLMHLRDRK